MRLVAFLVGLLPVAALGQSLAPYTPPAFSAGQTAPPYVFNSVSLSLNSTASADLYISKKASGQAATIHGQTNGLDRWQVILGNINAESGGNAGSDFQIVRYNDAGAFAGIPFSVTRSTGVTNITSFSFTQGFTVATLPTCDGTRPRSMLWVTDLLAPTYGGLLTGGGTVGRPVFCDGTAWRS